MTHHPVEFHAALLAVAAGSDKEQQYLQATKLRELQILRPDVEESGVSYAMGQNRSKKVIRKGLTSIKGVGIKAAEAIVKARPEGGFKTIANFAELVDHRKCTGLIHVRESGDLSVGTVNKLYEAGALERLV
jgi:DNA polymerase-3 subunit alpha